MFVGLLNLYIVSYPARVRQIMSYEIYLSFVLSFIYVSLWWIPLSGELSLYL